MSSNHSLWVLVRTSLSRRFERVPTIYGSSRNMKKISCLSENFQVFFFFFFWKGGGGGGGGCGEIFYIFE